MTHLSKTLLGMAAIAALALPPSISAQGMSVDAARAANGMKLWKKHGCGGCHAVGRRLGAPDLAGVSERRSVEWLHRWMHDTKAMLETDSTAKALLAEAKGARMPQFKMSDTDIDDLLNFIAQETAKKRHGV
jgi:cytochrome c551/c552